MSIVDRLHESIENEAWSCSIENFWFTVHD